MRAKQWSTDGYNANVATLPMILLHQPLLKVPAIDLSAK